MPLGPYTLEKHPAYIIFRKGGSGTPDDDPGYHVIYMTGFTAISDVLPHIDSGTRKGRPYPIAVKSWFTSSGTIIPLSFKFEDDDGEIHYIQNIHVKSSEEKHYAGIPSRDFSCTAVLGGLEQSFRLVYYPAESKWVMIM